MIMEIMAGAMKYIRIISIMRLTDDIADSDMEA
jgi:hypothetical protein